mmetsp:Transcript_40791/g.100773  ORF Transcript_40791/g.100773 Transcript_40791/m.100773 type:complete len:229 (-) Transcript_40791:108-794(-)|eukprot:CAMPEP_0197586690 /NCGR_PEP_ID=MMETSP1326-20131121/8582_1 /TAXON_ID=1155430 /ORGANISM="Genus nov. species nov., Strain RCC2288" /LENGTH=228 /DNA_ID=CAMNT_0043151347 /DNA_START=200 /DNA_END=886 /DNA_ORIENTATION=-
MAVLMIRSSAVRSALLFLAAAALLVCGAVAEDPAGAPTSSVAHLIVHKSVVETQLVIGQNMTIKIEVFNAGSSIARAVEVTDPGFDSGNFEVSGGASTTASFASLAPGATKVLSFVVVPKVTGQFSAGPCKVTYLASSASTETTSGVSNALPKIAILSIADKHVDTALTVGAYLSLGFCRTMDDWKRGAMIAGVGSLLLGGNWLALKGKDALAQNRRRKAIESLTKEE